MPTLLLAIALCLLAGCATLPVRPDVAFYVNPEPMLIPQEPVARPGKRALTPPSVPAPICLTDADHLALATYLDQIDARR